MMEWVKGLVIASFAVLMPIHAAMAAAGVLIVSDLILGMWVARKRGEKLTSAAMRRTISKMLIYQSAIITGFICETWLLSGFIPVSKLVSGVIGVVEMKSILENANSISGGDIFAKVIKALGSKNDVNEPPNDDSPGAA